MLALVKNMPGSHRSKLNEYGNALHKAMSNKYCSHPGASSRSCRGQIVHAHLISRSDVLSKIARDGHVYAPIRNFFKLMDKGQFFYELKGIKEVTTFTGFCEFHDSSTFRPLEAEPLIGTPEQ